jgi:hypothetical protein
VPNDGRVIGGNFANEISISVVTDKTGTQQFTIPIAVDAVPSYNSIENMSQLMILLTVIALLIIISGIIITAAVLLTGRRPRPIPQ